MKVADVDIVMVPGWSGSGPDHWQSRWQRNLPNTRRVEQDDWINAQKDQWVGALITTISACQRPTILVGHSLGVMTIAHTAHKLPDGMINGAFLVAPADVEHAEQWPDTDGHYLNPVECGFAPIPVQPLPFPTALVASSNDPYCAFDRAKYFSKAWRADLVDAGPRGHINIESGNGPWPEGLLRFGKFLQKLG